MDVQIIKHEDKEYKFANTYNIHFSNFHKPVSLDEFSLNIIDLQEENLWRNSDNNDENIDCSKDLQHIFEMIDNSKSSKSIIVLPQNYVFKYKFLRKNNYQYSKRISDILYNVQKILETDSYYSIKYETTKTIIDKTIVNSDFYFDNLRFGKGITFSDKSNKFVTIQRGKKYLTTLDFSSNGDLLFKYLKSINVISFQEKIPKWAINYNFLNDAIQKNVINENRLIIEKAYSEINIAQEILDENKRYKSILYTNSNELVEVIYDILQQILKCNMSKFVDMKKEDFLIKKDNVTFIGEIKGETSNVKSTNIAQIYTHLQEYSDALDEQGLDEVVKSVLIVNHQRNKPINEREPVHIKQIESAAKNECLIIETSTLLKLFEKFRNKEVTSQEIEELFKKEVGLLKLTCLSKALQMEVKTNE